ncbi:hydantoinase B/oxoprolinase family protein, partial [bacterium]|nr:hydantoinase B/oxoprolinase family protein [bacterium]
MALDAVERTLYAQLLEALCEEMGLVLQQSAYSPNIKERRDFSTAIFDAGGGMAAQGRNIPVHLGSMPLSVRAVLDALSLQDGDVALLNDPYHGGTHLPDLTVATPYYSSRPGHAAARSARLPLCYLANRAHHADVGGMSPGSLPISSEIYQEGLVI